MDREFDRICYGAGSRCPYRGTKCPMDIPIDEESCCDNDYESCFIYTRIRADDKYSLEDDII